MKVSDIMTTNVVTIPSNTSIADAKRLMAAHRFRRLPVVDRGKLVGIVTEHRLEQVSPSKATSLTVWELSCRMLRCLSVTLAPNTSQSLARQPGSGC